MEQVKEEKTPSRCEGGPVAQGIYVSIVDHADEGKLQTAVKVDVIQGMFVAMVDQEEEGKGPVMMERGCTKHVCLNCGSDRRRKSSQ